MDERNDVFGDFVGSTNESSDISVGESDVSGVNMLAKPNTSSEKGKKTVFKEDLDEGVYDSLLDSASKLQEDFRGIEINNGTRQLVQAAGEHLGHVTKLLGRAKDYIIHQRLVAEGKIVPKSEDVVDNGEKDKSE